MTDVSDQRLLALGDALRAHAGRWSSRDASYDADAARILL